VQCDDPLLLSARRYDQYEVSIDNMFDWKRCENSPDPRMKFKEIHEVKTVLKRGSSQIARVVSKFTYEDSSLDEVMDTRTVVTDGYSAYWLVGDVGAVQVDHNIAIQNGSRQSNTIKGTVGPDLVDYVLDFA